MQRSLTRHLPTIASLAVGILPVIVLIVYFDVPRKLILGWGILSYIVGVTALKIPLYHFVVVKFIQPKLSHLWIGITQGFVSSVTELGSALLFFIYVVPDLSFAQLVGFSITAGSVEAIILPFIKNPLQGTPLEAHAEEVFSRAAERKTSEWWGVVERVFASGTHMASRGLVYIGLNTGNPLPTIIAVYSFAALDGIGYYAHLQKWTFDNTRVLIKFYCYFLCITALLISCFLFYYFKM